MKEKLQQLESRGYKLIGDLPDGRCTYNNARLSYFLFTKGYEYYLCHGQFLSDSVNISFDENNEPMGPVLKSLGQIFSKITDKNLIFTLVHVKPVMGYPEPQRIMLFNQATQSGHKALLGPYFAYPNKTQSRVGGEIYFKNGKLILLTRKSGTLQNNCEEFLNSTVPVLGLLSKKVYFSKVTDEEVEAELIIRQQMLDLQEPYFSIAGSEAKPMADEKAFFTTAHSPVKRSQAFTLFDAPRYTVTPPKRKLNIEMRMECFTP
ncbi:MAG: hypothetical protein H0U75_09680 [Legionella sp.]|nr:hypothetical protein [Legionella sp.]